MDFDLLLDALTQIQKATQEIVTAVDKLLDMAEQLPPTKGEKEVL